MSAINTKQLLKTWIYNQLGGGVINIELDENTISDHIDTAIQKFSDYSGDVTYSSALILTLSAGINEYDMPANTANVVNFESSSASGGIQTPFSSMNILYNAGAFDQLLWDQGQYSGIVSFELGMEHLELVKKLLTVTFDIKYNKYTNKLTVLPIPTEDVIGVLEIYTKYDPGQGASEIYNELWVKHYALALSKITLGYIWGKYENTPLPDGSSLNWSMMGSDGKEEKEKLEEELLLKYSPPLGFFVE